jgi:signal transduction histidine kinase
MTSLRANLFGIWLLSLAASLAVGWMLVQFYRQSSAALVAGAEADLTRACDRIGDAYAYYISGWAGPPPLPDDTATQDDLDTLARAALAPSRRMTGGILRDPADIRPETAASRAAAEALAGQGIFLDEAVAGSRTELTLACRLSGPIPDLAAFVSTDVESAPIYGRLRDGLGILLALMLGLAGSLTWLVAAWSRRARRLEQALAHSGAEGLPHLGPTGEAELDRIAAALNQANARLRAARAETEAASARAAEAERLAALGRVAAGVAHEIRNPLATMRLRAEGALALDAAQDANRAAQRGQAALASILGQIGRLDLLSRELLDMTHRREPHPEQTDLAAFLGQCAADAADGRLATDADPGDAAFDPDTIGRALGNLLSNALRHVGPAGHVWLRARRAPDALRFEVEDDGPGITPELRASLFEPFVTGRADGTGLGLAIARELAEAHGGSLELTRAAPGALFALTIPLERR